MTRQMRVHLFRRIARAGGRAPGLLPAETGAELAALFPAILDRAWAPSLPARSGFALSLCEIRRAHSQRARLKGELCMGRFRQRMCLRA